MTTNTGNKSDKRRDQHNAKQERRRAAKRRERELAEAMRSRGEVPSMKDIRRIIRLSNNFDF